MANLDLITLNVNGLRNTVKRRAIFKLLRKRGADLVLIQETHSTREIEKLWSSEWGGSILFAHGSSNSRGVAVLLPRNPQIKINSQMSDSEGRILRVQIEKEGALFTLLNAYAPTADKPEDQISFLDDLEKCLQEADTPSLIIGGDLNICIEPAQDRSSRRDPDPSQNCHVNSGVSQRLRSLMEEFQVLDAWRLTNSTANQYTFRRRAYASRLDLWLISEHLSELIHRSEIIPVALSDHSAVTLLLRAIPEHRGPGCWKFNNELLGCEEFTVAMGEFLESYQLPDLPSAHSRWDFLKYEIRRFASDFQKKTRSESKRRKRDLESALKELGKMNLVQDPDKEQEYQSCKRELAEIELAEANKTILRSKANWAQVGERPSKYFLNLQKRKAKNNTMSQIYDGSGHLTSDPRKILEATGSFFEKLYCDETTTAPLDEMDWNSLNIPKIRARSKENLEEPYSERELHAALRRMNLDKCPGSDGLTAEFYLKFWESLKGPLMESIHHGLAVGNLSTEQKRGIINLIPKKDSDRRKIGNWRPISLLNIDYKILTKAMSLRLQPILKEIIHTDQTGFLPGRYIGENLRTIQDVIDYTNLSSGSALLMALDFRKAFDSVRWEFIFKAFKEFGFGQNFIDGLKTIFKDIQSCTTNAGFTLRYFSPKQGVRQGCCVAPYLFIVAVEVLGIQIRHREEVRGVVLGPREVKLSQFADDLTVFVADEQSASRLLELIEDFGAFSGLKLNREKSQLMALGAEPNTTLSLRDLHSVKRVKILGLWFSANRSLMDHYLWNFKDNLNKIRGICDSWFNRDLSIKGKISVVNSLLVSLLQYAASNSELPDQVTTELRRIVTHFIWNKRRAKVAYNTLIQNVDRGGLRLADLKLRSNVAKLGWVKRLMNNPNSFSGRFLSFLAGTTHSRCLFQGKIGGLPDNFKASKFYSEIFHLWIGLHGFPPATEEGVRDEILWCNKRIKIDSRPICWREWMNRGVWRVEDIVAPGEGRFLSHTELNNIYGTQASFLDALQLRQSIPKTWRYKLSPQGKGPQRDSLLIIVEGKQIVDILKELPRKLYTRLLPVHGQPPRPQGKWETVFQDSALLDDWGLLYHSPFRAVRETRLQALQYKIFHRIIPCRRYLNIIGIAPSEKCLFCPEVDTIQHFFLECPVAKRLWSKIADWFRRIDGPDLVALAAEEIILGATLPSKTAPMINFITLFTKAFIFRQKLFHGGEMGLIGWLGEFKKKLQVERYICGREDRMGKFARWEKIFQALG